MLSNCLIFVNILLFYPKRPKLDTEKNSIVGCDCPYTIDGQYWLDSLDMCKVMPGVINFDLVNYLVGTKPP